MAGVAHEGTDDMTGTEATRTLELVATAERAVVRLLLAMGEPVPHVGETGCCRGPGRRAAIGGETGTD